MQQASVMVTGSGTGASAQQRMALARRGYDVLINIRAALTRRHSRRPPAAPRADTLLQQAMWRRTRTVARWRGAQWTAGAGSTPW